jgi:ribosomal-protein-alanine N-acetyltransferase
MTPGGPLPFQVRPGGRKDLESIARIQSSSPEAACWEPYSYLEQHLLVAVSETGVVGFLVWRNIGPAENEILNVAVASAERRKGIARLLIQTALREMRGDVFLEVRESNTAARRLYEGYGFCLAGIRKQYYEHPAEAAIVMRFQSC